MANFGDINMAGFQLLMAARKDKRDHLLNTAKSVADIGSKAVGTYAAIEDVKRKKDEVEIKREDIGIRKGDLEIRRADSSRKQKEFEWEQEDRKQVEDFRAEMGDKKIPVKMSDGSTVDLPVSMLSMSQIIEAMKLQQMAERQYEGKILAATHKRTGEGSAIVERFMSVGATTRNYSPAQFEEALNNDDSLKLKLGLGGTSR